MESGKMANVNAAAVMHNGQWLKISDRDEVNDLQSQNRILNNQVSVLNNKVSNMHQDVWLECSAQGVNSGRFLFNPMQNRMLGIGILGFNTLTDAVNGSYYDHIKVWPPYGYRFDGNTNYYTSTATSNMFHITQADGAIILSSDLNTAPGYPMIVDSYVQAYKI